MSASFALIPGEGASPRVRACGKAPSPRPSPRKRGEGAVAPCHMDGFRDNRYRTASITSPIFPNISPISSSLTIRGGLTAMVSPVTRIMMPCSWNAFSIAA